MLIRIALQDPITAKRNLTQYGIKDVTFLSTREAKFVDNLIGAIEASDQEAYTAVVVEHDRITPLDSWKTNILLKIKKTIEDEDPLT